MRNEMTERPIQTAVRAALLLAVTAGLAGCGAVAAPCRVGSAALDIVPIVGHIAAAPTDACADVIDPSPVP
jgi:hypothetical protein